MARIADINIDSWGRHGFIVNGSFNDMQVVSTRIFTDYGDALKEMQRQLLREIFRHETHINHDPSGIFHWDELPKREEPDR